MTPGFSGADLANVINEAALLSARRNANNVTFEDFEAAIERVVGGLEQRSRVMNPKERQTVAFHECGHALVASIVPSGDPVSKISIIPRSRGALGYTMQMPKEDRYLVSIEELEDQIAMMMGGRAAEHLMCGPGPRLGSCSCDSDGSREGRVADAAGKGSTSNAPLRNRAVGYKIGTASRNVKKMD